MDRSCWEADKRTNRVLRHPGWTAQIGVLSVADLSFFNQDVPMHAFLHGLPHSGGLPLAAYASSA